ncbi:MAG: hypothetical protein ACOYD0_02630 [Candidatus Nanopelagicales bacterium]
MPLGTAAILAGCSTTGVAGDVPQAVDLGGEVVAAGPQADSDAAGAVGSSKPGAATGEPRTGDSQSVVPLSTTAPVSQERRAIAAAAVVEYASKVGITVTELRVSTESAKSSDADLRAKASGRAVRLALLVSRVKGTWKVVQAREIPTGPTP